MEELITWTNTNLKDRLLHPLIVIGIFVVNFLAIHPFQDGNGRLSRILTNLLLLKSGYNYTAYSSLESIIEDNKSSYYLALRETQATLKNKEPNYEPWLTFFIKSLEKQKVRLEYKLDHLQDSYVDIDTVNLDDLPEIALEIYKLFDNTDRITIDYIKSKLDASESKIKRNLLLLQNKNIIKKHGVTKGSWYVKL
jgi:Fic family protein